MASYILRRLFLTIPSLFAVSLIVFGAVRVIPGDVCRLVLQTPEVTSEQCASVEKKLGLDRPVVEQYGKWISGVAAGDLGRSMISDRDVMGEIRNRMNLTFELSLIASSIALLVGIPAGVYSAVRQDRFGDYALRLITIGWLSMPGFWVATILITFPAKWWGYTTPVGYVQIWQDPAKNIEQLLLPAISLGLALTGTLARLTRSSMVEVLRQDYVRTARAKGLREATVLRRHALKNALLPVVTIFGLQLGFLLGGTVVLESIYSLPGLGTLLLTSVTYKDYTAIQGIVLFFALLIALINIMVDASYALIDPRVRYS